MTNAMSSDFLSFIFHGKVRMSLDFHLMIFIFRSWFDLVDVMLTFLNFILKIFESLQIIDIGSPISQASENVWEVLQAILRTAVQIWYFIVSRICFIKNHSRDHFQWPLRCQRTFSSPWDNFIIVLADNTSNNNTFVCKRHYVGDYMTGLVQTSSEVTESWSSSPLIVSWDSFSHQTYTRLKIDGCHYLYFSYHYIYYLCFLNKF